MNKFGQAIRNAREANNLLLRHLASKLDIDTAILSKIERGERMPKKELVIKIASTLSLRKEDLITLWLAEKIYDIVEDEQQAYAAIKVASKEIKDLKK